MPVFNSFSTVSTLSPLRVRHLEPSLPKGTSRSLSVIKIYEKCVISTEAAHSLIVGCVVEKPLLYRRCRPTDSFEPIPST
jgi:hypothetical protein